MEEATALLAKRKADLRMIQTWNKRVCGDPMHAQIVRVFAEYCERVCDALEAYMREPTVYHEARAIVDGRVFDLLIGDILASRKHGH